MARVSTNISIDADLKKRAQELLSEMGLDLSTAITLYLTQIIRTHKIPFEIVADPFYSDANQKYLEKVISDIESGKAKLVSHDLIEVEE